MNSAKPAITKEISYPLLSTVTDFRTSINRSLIFKYETYYNDTVFVIEVGIVELLVEAELTYPNYDVVVCDSSSL